MQHRQDSGTEFGLVVQDESETARVAQAVARAAVSGDVIALHGDLGSGKTAFARGFIRALTEPDEEVPSPTFTLVQTYPADAGTIYHFDFYRIDDPEEAWEIGIEEAFGDGIALIEWPEELGTILPPDRLDVGLHIPADADESVRHITLSAGARWIARLDDLRRHIAEYLDD